MRVLAAEAGLNLLAVAIPQLVKPEVGASERVTLTMPILTYLLTYQVGASERALASLFERARAHAPCLLFLDELQAIFGKRGAIPDPTPTPTPKPKPKPEPNPKPNPNPNQVSVAPSAAWGSSCSPNCC